MMRPSVGLAVILGAIAVPGAAPPPVRQPIDRAARPSIPDDLARITFSVTGTPTVPLALVHLYSKDGFKGYVMLDGRGEVVWHFRTRDFPFGMARRRSGNFVFMDKGRGIVEVTPAGEVVREIPQRDAENEMHHDLTVSPDDTVVYIAFDTAEFEGKRVKGEAIYEWTPERNLNVKRWRSWDHLTPALDRGPRFAGEWMHANSLAFGSRGNLIVSSHYLNQIFSIAPDWKSIEWRLGGPRASIAVPRGEEFSGQHTARETGPGRLLLFDNGRDRECCSRAVEFSMEGGAARKIWEWKPAQANYASAVSSARRLANGHTLVAFGMSKDSAGSSGPTEAFEVTPSGEAIWHLVVSGTTTMFRVEPIASLTGATVVR